MPMGKGADRVHIRNAFLDRELNIQAVFIDGERVDKPC